MKTNKKIDYAKRIYGMIMCVLFFCLLDFILFEIPLTFTTETTVEKITVYGQDKLIVCYAYDWNCYYYDQYYQELSSNQYYICEDGLEDFRFQDSITISNYNNEDKVCLIMTETKHWKPIFNWSEF